MKTKLAVLLGSVPATLWAGDGGTATWHARTLPEALAYLLIFAAVGILAAVVGYKVFDKCTPGDLNKEIIENKNVAAAIIGGAVILGVCLIIAAAMIG
jgi:uncharacterized membrane protein YjfL (UPF0719 family)